MMASGNVSVKEAAEMQRLITQARAGQGRDLSHLFDKVARAHSELTIQKLAHLVVQADDNGFLCSGAKPMVFNTIKNSILKGTFERDVEAASDTAAHAAAVSDQTGANDRVAASNVARALELQQKETELNAEIHKVGAW